MSQTKHQIKELLSAAGTEPRHRFGQNFMIDQNLVRLIAEAGEIGNTDTVIEVGPGTGTLTEELLGRAGRVIAVEIDRDLAAMLRERFAANTKFELIEGDALASKHELNPELLSHLRSAGVSPVPARAGRPCYKLVANLPYNIASPLIIELLLAGVEMLVFTVQREVADRLRASHEDDAYGPLSVVAQMLAKVEILRTLPPQAFWPSPKIESALVRMRRDDHLGESAGDFGRFVHKLFSSRRKTLRKALTMAGFEPENALAALSIDPQLRPENLSPPQIQSLFVALAGQAQEGK